MIFLSAENLLNSVTALEPTLVAECLRSNNQALQGFKAINQATTENWVFCSDTKAKQLLICKAGGVVLSPNSWEIYGQSICSENIIICSQPYAFFALAAQVFESQVSLNNTEEKYYHDTAQIHPTAVLGKGVRLGAFVTIAAYTIIGDGSTIESHCAIGPSCVIGNNTQLFNHVTLYKNTRIGSNCIIHSGTIVGADGFGFAPYQKRWLKIPQTGTVVIGDDVEIGANCTIDRGALGDTIIGRGTKLDNLIQIAHNVQIGEDCAFASGVGIAGSAILGNRIQVGGKAGILGHLSICDDVVISSFTLVTKTISKVGFYTGIYPIQENSEWEKNAVSLKHLANLRKQLKQLVITKNQSD
jgi:UDP-3-O-[3-hydroxymyristoyl] glucosamine N-acyltransferase